MLAAIALLPALAEAQAIEAWVQRYNGPGNLQDSASGMAVDASGTVYVTGSADIGGGMDYVTIKYSSAGVPLWTNLYRGPGDFGADAYALTVDASGDVIVTGHAGGDCLTIKYSSAGVPSWTNRYHGPGNGIDAGTQLAADSNGNVFVTGRSTGAGGNRDYATIKYSSVGVPVWTNRYNGPGNGDDWPNGLAVDASGNVVVTGYSTGSGTDYDYATIKYSGEGVALWLRRYNGPVNGIDRATAVAVDNGGNVIVTGYSDGSTNPWNDDYLMIKYSSAGVPLWTNRYTALADHDDQAAAVAVDANGDVIVTGFSFSNDVECDYATIKYSSAGVPLWTNRYQGPGDGNDSPAAITVDASGNVYVTGRAWWGSGTGLDYITVAYSSAGVPLWTNRYNGPGNYADVPCAITVDASGNVYVAGSSYGNGSGNDFATIKYVVPPIIARQPLSCMNAVGTTASFSVEAAGGLPLSYQWRRQGTNLVDGGNISGVATTNLVITNVQLTDAAGYSVVVTNAYGSTTSAVAQLTVYVPPNPGRFSNLSYSPETGLSFIFRDGTVGRPYRIQTSSSLAAGSWVDWQSFTYNGPIGFMDVSATGTERRFYRAISP